MLSWRLQMTLAFAKIMCTLFQCLRRILFYTLLPSSVNKMVELISSPGAWSRSSKSTFNEVYFWGLIQTFQKPTRIAAELTTHDVYKYNILSFLREPWIDEIYKMSIGVSTGELNCQCALMKVNEGCWMSRSLLFRHTLLDRLLSHLRSAKYYMSFGALICFT